MTTCTAITKAGDQCEAKARPDSDPPRCRVTRYACGNLAGVAEKSKVIAVKVDPELWAKVRAKADDKSVSVSALLRRSLEKWVEA